MFDGMIKTMMTFDEGAYAREVYIKREDIERLYQYLSPEPVYANTCLRAARAGHGSLIPYRDKDGREDFACICRIVRPISCLTN